jgi:apolipoprotein D and lipocalin family protein
VVVQEMTGRMKHSTILLAVLILTACVGKPDFPRLDTVPQVDLNRYLGTWYELASIPMRFQTQCFRDTQATYSMAEHGLIKVDNQCTREDGSISRIEGRARVTEPVSKAKLEVTFINFLGNWWPWLGDYWVIALADDYRYAVVGHPSRDYAWVLARQTQLPATDWANIKKTLKEGGYDLCRIKLSRQGSHQPTASNLCN